MTAGRREKFRDKLPFWRLGGFGGSGAMGYEMMGKPEKDPLHRTNDRYQEKIQTLKTKIQGESKCGNLKVRRHFSFMT